MEFTHLHVHTEYSLLDGSNKIKEYVARVKELGMDSAAITDHGVMYGVIDFYRAAREAGINPILGCEVYVAPGSRFDREVGSGDDRYYHLVLLAENNQGYSNLMKIEPFCVGLNPPQAAAAGKPPFVAATFQFLKISCPFGTSLLKLLRVSRSALVGAFLSKPCWERVR